jgi:hypothetical protein
MVVEGFVKLLGAVCVRFEQRKARRPMTVGNKALEVVDRSEDLEMAQVLDEACDIARGSRVSGRVCTSPDVRL